MQAFDPNKTQQSNPAEEPTSDQGDDKYHNLDYIQEVLEGDDKDELEKTREKQGWTEEELKLYGFFAKLRKEAVEKASKETEERKLKGELPTAEEFSAGAFCETIEPQVRDAVFLLREKGYNTYESGFYDFAEQRIGTSWNNKDDEDNRENEDDKNDFEGYAPSADLENFLTENDVEMTIGVNYISLNFKKEKDLDEIKKIWDKVADDLPSLQKPVEISTTGLASNFRKKHARNPYLPKELSEMMPEDEWEELHADQIMETLGVNLIDFEGKETLDLGAGDAELAKTLKKNGINIISLDKKLPEKDYSKIEFVLGGSENLPFEDESIDLIVSHASVPFVLDTTEQVEKTISESKRVLKKGGEFRFGPTGLASETLGDIFTEEEYKNFTTEERVERVQEKSLEILKKIDPSIKEVKEGDKSYYFLRK